MRSLLGLHECWGVLKLRSEGDFYWGAPNHGNDKSFGFFVECHHNCCSSCGQKCNHPHRQKNPFLGPWLRARASKLKLFFILQTHDEKREERGWDRRMDGVV